ncbi:hypothetical protein LUZ63_016029 [Rhynchospora breviuscula]|uniref:Receptor kinase-like protein Xa21 n=1 Tax=Rhynchospora breviuscula TaxID=2022672 RepID=A0A9Q0HMY5_9POAL|nr:hypothetical protein LUZ63_016029 [Rhynchospora breviuscula]
MSSSSFFLVSPIGLGDTLLQILLISLLLLIPSNTIASNGTETERDVLALLSFKSLIWNDPSGALSSWNVSVHHCRWYGIRCGRRHPNRVTALDLNSLQLSGQVSSSLANLTFLQRLSLSDNRLSGRIPELGQMMRLRFLNLSVNYLDGTIPPLPGNCSLEYFSLRTNNLKGVVPSNIVQCKKLTVINLNHNFLVGSISPELDFLQQLTMLSLSVNNLNGTIPATLGNLTNLYILDLYQNHFAGVIPASLGQLQSLQWIQINDNLLSGKIPRSLFNISTMIRFDLSINYLEGSLPHSMCDAFQQVQKLVLYENQLKGQIPTSISNCSMLDTIDFSLNGFTGTIPSSIGTLQKLSFLQIGANQLEAKTPKEWNFVDALINCTFLQLLDLGYNQLQGIIPRSLANLSSLEILRLSGNLISGSIPSEFSKLTNLIQLEIKQTLLKGNIPVEIGYLQNLQSLDISNNKLFGKIPSNFGNVTRMSRFLLSDNAFEGRIPPSLSNMQFLEVMDISNNKFIGEIPKDIMNIHSLSYGLNLSHNYLNGSVPSEIGKLKNVAQIYLSYNNLSGQIPSSVDGCQLLQILHLEGNLLQGPIPSSLSNLKGLQELDLSSNNFSGQVPLFLGEIGFAHLNISFNNFQGELPKEGVFKNATAIDVRGNPELCGEVPEILLPKCISSSPASEHHSRSIKIILYCIACGILCVSLTICLFIGYLWKRKSKGIPHAIMTMISKYERVSYNDIFRATCGFSLENLIGTGTFGVVYKAVMSFKTVQTVAVKVLNLNQHGAFKSFLSECEALRNARHRNLIKILSVCSSIDHHGNDFKALVFEFMPNGSLETWLHPNSYMNQLARCLSLIQRVNIAIDIAMALEYLHDHKPMPIIHCDLKPSNVLLDENMTARVGDFGLARFLVQPDTTPAQSITSTHGIKGSIGYIPPEYGMGGQASPQGDVYSYGILLLEMFTALSPTDERFRDGLSLPKHVEMAFPDQVMDILDINLSSTDHAIEGFLDCLVSVIRCGLLCSRELAKERIAMNDVVKELNLVRAKLVRYQIFEHDLSK